MHADTCASQRQLLAPPASARHCARLSSRAEGALCFGGLNRTVTPRRCAYHRAAASKLPRCGVINRTPLPSASASSRTLKFTQSTLAATSSSGLNQSQGDSPIIRAACIADSRANRGAAKIGSLSAVAVAFAPLQDSWRIRGPQTGRTNIANPAKRPATFCTAPSGNLLIKRNKASIRYTPDGGRPESAEESTCWSRSAAGRRQRLYWTGFRATFAVDHRASTEFLTVCCSCATKLEMFELQSRCRRFNRTTCGANHQIPLKRGHFFMSRQRQTWFANACRNRSPCEHVICPWAMPATLGEVICRTNIFSPLNRFPKAIRTRSPIRFPMPFSTPSWRRTNTRRVAAETLCTTGLVLLAGEITTRANIDYIQIARDTIKRIGYDNTEYGIDYKGCSVRFATTNKARTLPRASTKARAWTSNRAPATRA